MAEQPEHSWQQTLRRRAMVLAGVFVLWTIAVEARLVYLQVVEHDDLTQYAESQQSLTIPISAKRGEIFDRNARLLAYSVTVESIYAAARDVENVADTIAKVCAALADCSKDDRQQLTRRLTTPKKDGRLPASVVIRKVVTPEQAKRVRDLELKSIYLLPENRRFYPNMQLGAHVLGFVGREENLAAKGLGGLEARHDTIISGTPGEVLLQTDAKGRPFNRIEKVPTPGASLELTIDSNIQYVAERELREGVKWSGAKGGSVIVIDPFTGEILALANEPTFNPNAYSNYGDDAKRNRAIQDQYDPGSTFKAVTASAALEEKVFSPTDLIDTNPGAIRFGDRVIDEAKGHNYGSISFEDVIVKSSNVGAVKIGLRIGKERLSSWVGRFGFGTRLSPDMPGENAGQVTPLAELNDSAIASMAMGYQIGVTPLQMATAVSSIANGGELVQPHVVRAIIRDGVREPVERKVLRRTVSSGVAQELTAIMEGVVTRGTGKSAQIAGYTIAGKTGTAAKIVNHRYSTTDYNVSFVGFLPSRDPMFTILVVIDTPTKVSPYGGTVAAPIFQKVAEAVMRSEGVPPSENRAPPVVIARRDQVVERRASGPVEPPRIVPLVSAASADGAVPDFTGMSAREALNAIVRLGLSPRVLGNGQVVSQRPEPGTALESVDAATVWLDRRPRKPAQVDESVGTAGTQTNARSTR